MGVMGDDRTYLHKNKIFSLFLNNISIDYALMLQSTFIKNYDRPQRFLHLDASFEDHGTSST
jgi:hypothetical protein